MSSDPVVDEIRAIREKLAANFDFDVEAIGRDAQRREAAGDRQVVSRQPRAPIQFVRPPAKTA